jgi:hypothetical protein
MVKKDKFLRSRDVAYILDCSPDDVMVLAKEGQLKGNKKGRFWRFRVSDVEAYKRREIKAQRAAP